jgi:hypothetical protein
MLRNLLKNILPRPAPPAPAAPPPPPATPEAEQRALLAVHSQLAQKTLPGEHYQKVLTAIHTRLKPRTYIEIGIDAGLTLALARPETQAIGVDPAPKISAPPGPNQKIFRLKSDDFFAGTDVKKEFGGRPVDLAFIDGMHLFEFALRDFIAVERLCTRDSTILLHDTYPLDRLTAERNRQTIFWSGDIWRTVLAIKKYRPDLSIHTIATQPTGLTIIRGLDPESRVLAERVDEIVAEFLALDYAVLDHDKAAALNLTPNTPQQLAALLN